MTVRFSIAAPSFPECTTLFYHIFFVLSIVWDDFPRFQNEIMFFRLPQHKDPKIRTFFYTKIAVFDGCFIRSYIIKKRSLVSCVLPRRLFSWQNSVKKHKKFSVYAILYCKKAKEKISFAKNVHFFVFALDKCADVCILL